jgi:hypothetical protein
VRDRAAQLLFEGVEEGRTSSVDDDPQGRQGGELSGPENPAAEGEEREGGQPEDCQSSGDGADLLTDG